MGLGSAPMEYVQTVSIVCHRCFTYRCYGEVELRPGSEHLNGPCLNWERGRSSVHLPRSRVISGVLSWEDIKLSHNNVPGIKRYEL